MVGPIASTPAPAASPRPAPPSPNAPILPPRVGEVQDSGAGHHGSIAALRWTSLGVSKVLGDVHVGAADLSGAVAVRGTFDADRVRVRGTLEVQGAARVAEELVLSGDARFLAELSAGSMRADGSMEVRGTLAVAQALQWSGHLDAGGDVSADSVSFDGRLTARGGLVARRVEGRLREASTVASIRARTLTLDRHAPLFGRKGALSVLRIEAEEVRLSGTVCQYLKADRITLGPDCHIARLDGTVLARHPSAHVGPESSSPRPYGLSR